MGVPLYLFLFFASAAGVILLYWTVELATDKKSAPNYRLKTGVASVASSKLGFKKSCQLVALRKQELHTYDLRRGAHLNANNQDISYKAGAQIWAIPKMGLKGRNLHFN